MFSVRAARLAVIQNPHGCLFGNGIVLQSPHPAGFLLPPWMGATSVVPGARQTREQESHAGPEQDGGNVCRAGSTPDEGARIPHRPLQLPQGGPCPRTTGLGHSTTVIMAMASCARMARPAGSCPSGSISRFHSPPQLPKPRQPAPGLAIRPVLPPKPLIYQRPTASPLRQFRGSC